MKFSNIIIVLLITSSLAVISLSNHAAQSTKPSKLTVYLAKKIITMDNSQPYATAVAVADGKIVSVGSLDSLQGWIKERGATIDPTFKDKIIMPGLIDPHVHPSLPAVLTQFPFIAPDDWSLPTGEFPGETTKKGYIDRLTELVNQHYNDPKHNPAIPFVTWGYHTLWHGDVYKQELNVLFPNQPVMLWHRSFHELIANDAALKLLKVDKTATIAHHEADWDKGHFWENGAMQLMLPKMSFMFAPKRYGQGMKNFFEMMHQSGTTTAMDMGMGVFGDPVGETALIRKVAEESKAPARLVLTPLVTDFIARGISPENALKEVEQWTEGNSHRVVYDKHFKLMMDGAIFSGASQMDFPGYKDGHKGMWMAPLERTYNYAKVFWDNGYQLHAHTNGDGSTKELINMVRRLQAGHPRVDHRTTLEHFAYATEAQLKQMSAIGMMVSANPYYQYILADTYAEQWLGEDRARKMVPLGTAKKHGLPIALHSDAPMAPLSPLTLVWTAVNRTTINGNKNIAGEKLTVDEALRAITIDAAWTMRWEDKIGSIVAGKKADFAILEQDPYQVDTKKLKDIKIWGTVFEGEKFPVKH
ncbi:amidohydrolase [Colwellia psychrerythraea]|uniref:Amidohydrolase 3 n=1 Tax=Colwellia psychrerythraea TaxID=28229 RepID=A0A099KZB0_COLPS|nr:amidohydrolase [Colwellia psychrerythraea]KGJ95152.1 Amidohydrolase 3 [Colwellia psychrerythraea]